MRTRTTTLTLAAAGALSLTLALAGCGGGGQSGSSGQGGSGGAEPVSTQSKAEACQVVNEGTAKLSSAANELMSSASGGDTAAVGEQIAAFQTELEKVGKDVTNSDVKPLFDDFSAAFGGLAEQIQAISTVDSGDADAVQTALADMETATTALTDAQSSLTEACAS
jgi:hypothetical protein